jgi:hypothetical protein
MPDRPAPDSISASAVGEYVYCARAHGLRRAIAGAPDAAAALRRAQGLPPDWRPAATVRLVRREQRRAAALAGGASAHRRAHGQVRAAGSLALAGLLLIAAALVLGLLPLLLPAP